jgi:hypothetical protein
MLMPIVGLVVGHPNSRRRVLDARLVQHASMLLTLLPASNPKDPNRPYPATATLATTSIASRHPARAGGATLIDHPERASGIELTQSLIGDHN